MFFCVATQAVARKQVKTLAGLSGELGATQEACWLPSAEGVLSSILHSYDQENVSFLPSEQELEGAVWLYSSVRFCFGFVLILSKCLESSGCPQGFQN